ncbi:MAG TPA: hypothetical protein PKD26_12685 [Pyrinomonadaceae bacterium]|nr:hypothetical protein [Pyrinomonadaceae bacterium]
MKLRIKGNSLRLRLSRTEVRELVANGYVEGRTVFGPSFGEQLVYRIKKGGNTIVTGHLENGQITVTAPAAIVDEWAGGDQLGFSGRQSLESGDVLDILVEKDLVCLKPRETEDESDNFPHPDAVSSC